MQADLAEARRITGDLGKLQAAGVVKGADAPEAGFYARVLRTFDGSLGAIHHYPDYRTTGSFKRRLTFNPRTAAWEDTSEP